MRALIIALVLTWIAAGCVVANIVDCVQDPSHPACGATDGSARDGAIDAAGAPDAGGDGDRPDARSGTCGDGALDGGEGCDDGGMAPGDGCDAVCTVEPGWGCWGAPSFCGRTAGRCPPGFAFIPAGPFEMGCRAGDVCFPDGREEPLHTVILGAYCLGITEVTVAQYSECPSCEPPETTPGCNWEIVGRENHPVNCVDWMQARAYCRWATAGAGDLPTEAQWEKGARGSDSVRILPWGDDPPDCTRANYDACGAMSTWAVGTGSPGGDSPYGLRDMAGNVWEWALDWFKINYYSSCECGSGCAIDPLNDCNGTSGFRVSRGGSYGNPALSIRCSNRNGGSPTERVASTGFRCAAPAMPE